MGYQESWLYVQPQMCFSNLIRAYEKTARTDYYRTIGAEPMSVVILKRPFGEVPKGVKLLWVCGDRCFHTPVGVFNGNLKSPAKLCFIPVEQVLDPDDYRLKGIVLNSRAPSENAYMKRYNVEDYIVRTRAERER